MSLYLCRKWQASPAAAFSFVCSVIHFYYLLDQILSLYSVLWIVFKGAVKKLFELFFDIRCIYFGNQLNGRL